MSTIKKYTGRIPACGCYCGGCPNYIREKNKCPGAESTDRCDNCKSYHLCCMERGITHCFECRTFPCAKFKAFRKRWLKYGQDFLENQKMLNEKGYDYFLEYWNNKADTHMNKNL